MRILSYIFNLFLGVVCLTASVEAYAQDTTGIIRRKPADTNTTQKLNMDAVYNRPFLTFNKAPIAIGGYLEANTDYTTKDGVNNGFNFHMQRMTLFFSSSIAKKIKFISELEFEEGTKEISIETAILDVEFHPLLTLRSGILLNPIGGFNQNHDGPRWDFIERPLAVTEIIPSTLSSVGMGFYGKSFMQNWIVGYELYLTNGFNDKLISNENNRTSFHESKDDVDKFNRSNSGLPMFNGKLAVRNRNIGEIGFSYLSGVYNQWRINGIQVDEKRTASIAAIDFNTSLLKGNLNITGEVSKSFVKLPANYIDNYGKQQLGAYTDVVYTLKQGRMLGWDKAKLNFGMRFEYVDFNIGAFKGSNEEKKDDVFIITPTIAFRPVGTAVLRLNYSYSTAKDIAGGNGGKTGSIKFGISSYF